MQKGTNKFNTNASRSNKAIETINGVFSFANLYRAYESCTLGVKWKYSTQNYMTNACCRIARLYKKIMNGTYKMSNVREFTICERGKTRKISALTFEDRIVQKCLCDNYLNKLLADSLIYDSGATLKDKGLSFTRKRILCHLARYYKKYGNDGFVLKIDLHHYFESIDHDILKQKLRKKIKDDDLYNFTISLIPGDLKGLGLGSQVSQICAMFYLNDVDHFIKEKLRYKYYARYMDDLYIFEPNRQKLINALSKIREKVKKNKLELNESKTKIYELKRGFIFCKIRYLLTDSGHILRYPGGHAIKRYYRKIKSGVEISIIRPSFVSYMRNFNIFNCY